MPLANELLQAISRPGGGAVGLILGAGCSVEPPTNIPVARRVSEEIHHSLVNDGVLQDGNCKNPADLSLLTDEVFARSEPHSQQAVVERLLARYDLKAATANDGYLIAAALLCEGAVSSVVTLNFDLALTNAVAQLGANSVVGIIESPNDLPTQKVLNVYYLHRNANADPECWILRTAALKTEWKDQWEPIIAARILTAPVIVFAGLGTPIAVLLESSRLIRNALPKTSIYQVDPANIGDSEFFQESGLDPSRYIQLGWGDFMDQLSQRLVAEHIHQLDQAMRTKIQEGLQPEEFDNFLQQLRPLGLLKQGKLRSDWLIDKRPYLPVSADVTGLVADLCLAVTMMMRVSGTSVRFVEDGILEFQRDGRIVASYIIASGRGHRRTAAVEADVSNRRHLYKRHQRKPNGIILGGTSDGVGVASTPPADITFGDVSTDNVVDQIGLPIYHITELRAEPHILRELLP